MTKTLVFPASCAKGTANWHYPHGSLTLLFTHLTSGQSVCVRPAYHKDVSATVGGRTFPLDIPESREYACVTSTSEEVSVTIRSPMLEYYLEYIPFTISTAATKG